MDEFGGPWFEGIGNTIRRKRSSRPRPESHPSPLSSTPVSDGGVSRVSSDENTGFDDNSRRKTFNLNQCASRGFSTTRADGDNCPNKKIKEDVGPNVIIPGDGLVNDNKLKRLKLKLGGITRTIQTKSSSHSASGSGSSTKTDRPRQQLVLQDNSDEDQSLPSDRKIGLQGIPWKDFSRGGFSFGNEGSLTGKVAHKSKRVPKKRVLDGAFDGDDVDDEIRYLEKLKTSRISKGSKYENLDDFASLRPGKDGKRAFEDTEDAENEGQVSDLPRESKTFTKRQRALLSGKDASGMGSIEFPNGLPPAPRKQKEKLSEVEQQLKKAEVAERRRMQNEKAARESEAEAIRKILGQDSSRKKREDKLKKRQEELAQEKAANAHISNMVRWVMGPAGTVVTFPDDMDLPHIFSSKPCSYPPPREKCAGPSCTHPYKYRDSKSKLPLCSLQCYKAIHESMQAETAC